MYSFHRYLFTLQILALLLFLQTSIFDASVNPLFHAISNGKSDIVEALLKCGANPNEPDDEGNYSLHVAVAGGHTNIVKVLLANGAYPNKADKENNYPLSCYK
jgi:ankyrin repeat protein